MPIALSKIKGIIMRCSAIGFSLTWFCQVNKTLNF